MLKLYWRFSENFLLKNVLIYSYVRQFHKSSVLDVKSLIKVNDYLLNRSVPASEILNSLLPEDSARLDQIKNAINFKLANGELVPKNIADDKYLELLCLSRGQQDKYIKFLAKKEISEEKDALKKSNKIPLKEILFSDEPYSKINNRFVSKYHNISEKKFNSNRMYEAIILKSQELVFDFSFENDMSRREVWELAKQLSLCYSVNKSLKEPFQMVFTNLKLGSLTYCDLKKSFTVGDPNKTFEDFPFVIHHNSYIDAYPHRNLIYLSPDSNTYFEEGEFDHEAIYIVGGIVDKSSVYPLTIAKARREKIHSRCIPIDRYVHWQNGQRGLPLNHVFNILSIARETNGNWGKAIRESIAPRALIPQRPRNRVLEMD